MTVFKAKKLVGSFPFQGITKSLAWDQAPQWGKRPKTGWKQKTKKNGQAKQAKGWTGEGERAAEPGDMPLMLPFHESRLWYHARSDWSNVSMLTDLRYCRQHSGNTDTDFEQPIQISLWDFLHIPWLQEEQKICGLLQKEKEAFKMLRLFYTLLW